MIEELEVPILVQDFVEDSELGLEVIVAGDLCQPVSWVHVTELVDPSPYVGGGEFILSAGVEARSGERVDAFIGALAFTGATALGWGLLAEDEHVPDAVVQACRRAGLTLLAVPTSTPFIAIGRWFFKRIQDRREANLRATIERSERFVRAISALPGGLLGLLGALRESVPRDAWVLGENGRTLAASATGEVPAEPTARAMEKLRDGTPASPNDVAVFGIDAGENTSSYLVVDIAPGEMTAEHRAAVGQALPLLGFVMAHEQELREAERRLAAELIDAVLSRRTQFSAGRLKAYGMDPHGPFVGVVAAVSEPGSVLVAAQRALASLRGNAVVAVWRETLTAIVQPVRGSNDLDAMGRTLRATLGSKSAVGIGSISTGLEELRLSLVQAQQAANLARRVSDGYVVHDRVESFALLLALQDEDVLASFRDSLLGPIKEHDIRRGTDLLPTLEAFLTSGGQWQATARKLHIHVNTLRHRLARCEELTGRELSSMDNRVDFFIAIRVQNPSHEVNGC